MLKKTSILILTLGLAVAGVAFQPPTRAEAATVRVQNLRTDLDGDGRRDIVRVYRVAKKTDYRTVYRVTVLTAKGRKATRTLTVQGSEETGRITRPLVTTAQLDGVRGRELVIQTMDFARGAWSEQDYTLLTWRRGKLVKQSDPAVGWARGWTIGSNGSEGFDTRSWFVFDVVDSVRSWLVCDEAVTYGPPTERSYSITIAVRKDGRWQVQGSRTADSPDPRCEPAADATLMLPKPPT